MGKYGNKELTQQENTVLETWRLSLLHKNLSLTQHKIKQTAAHMPVKQHFQPFLFLFLFFLIFSNILYQIEGYETCSVRYYWRGFMALINAMGMPTTGYLLTAFSLSRY